VDDKDVQNLHLKQLYEYSVVGSRLEAMPVIKQLGLPQIQRVSQYIRV